MSKLELTKSAINSFGYVDVDRKNLEIIEAEIRADERDKICKEQLEIISTDGIFGHDGVVTISQAAFEDIQDEIRADERQKILQDIKCEAQKFIHPEYDERDEFFNYGVEAVLDIIDDYGETNLRQQSEDEE